MGLAILNLIDKLINPLFKPSMIWLLGMLDIKYDSPWRNVMLDNIGDGIPGQFIGVPAAFLFGALQSIFPYALFGGVGGFIQSIIDQIKALSRQTLRLDSCQHPFLSNDWSLIRRINVGVGKI